MKKLSAIVCLLCMSCATRDSGKSISQDSTALPVDYAHSLKIVGANIRVRNSPTGNTIMKLNAGDECDVLDRGEPRFIEGRMDYWYKISFDDTIGWVFGAETDIAYLTPVREPVFDQLGACTPEDSLIVDKRALPTQKYWFKPDNTFSYSVAGAYAITGSYTWNENVVTLFPTLLSVTAQSVAQSGSISFYVSKRGRDMCFFLKEDRLPDNFYGPVGGCFCHY